MSTVGNIIRPLTSRDPQESHRVATPLELLTDLCFVVAIAQAAAQLHHAGSSGHLLEALLPFAMTFFAIWWAWLNFTWFASAFDNDDVVYRVLIILQILGSLVLAAGVDGVFEGDLTLVVVGYLIMRTALVALWLRAAHGDRDRRTTALRYAVGIMIVQCLWVIILFVPTAVMMPMFVVLAAAEICVPIFAERAGATSWHPHHVAERYSLLFIIVLGETILSATLAIKEGLALDHATPEVGFVVAGGIMIVFSVWWLYFSRSGGEALERIFAAESNGEYVWGFGHYFIFAAGAAIGAGLAARVDFWTGHAEAPAMVSAAMVTVPVAVLLAGIWLLHLRHHDASARTLVPFSITVVVTLGATFSPVPEVITGVACVLLVAVEVRLAGLVTTD